MSQPPRRGPEDSRQAPASEGSARAFMHHLKSSPPLEPLREIVSLLAGAGVPCALGGSGLLAAHGLTDRVRDWDLTTDTPLNCVIPRLGQAKFERFGSGGLHADEKLVLAGGAVELISRFSIRSGTEVVHLPTLIHGRWNDVPLGSREMWAIAYALLGRPEKSQRLFADLEARGSDADAVARLLGQPLPADLAARLAATVVRPHFK